MANATSHIIHRAIAYTGLRQMVYLSLDGSNRAHILSISKTGEPKPVIYQNPVPVTPESYNLTPPHDTNNLLR